MGGRLQRWLALWFVVQIALPCTAPLQNCDLRDLLGITRHDVPASPDTSTTPAQAPDPAVNSFVSPLAGSALRATPFVPVIDPAGSRWPYTSAFDLSPSPEVQRTVLRV